MLIIKHYYKLISSVSCFFFNVATRELKIMHMFHTVLPLEGTELASPVATEYLKALVLSDQNRI